MREGMLPNDSRKHLIPLDAEVQIAIFSLLHHHKKYKLQDGRQLIKLPVIALSWLQILMQASLFPRNSIRGILKLVSEGKGNPRAF